MTAINSVILWHTMTRADKLSLICQLSTMRIGLLEKSRAKRAAKGRKKKLAVRNTEFKSPELRKFFDSMPDDMKRFIGR